MSSPSQAFEEVLISKTLLNREAMQEIFNSMRLRDEWKPNYRSRKINDFVLISTDHGSWEILNEEEFTLLRGIAIPDKLYKRLETSGAIITKENATIVMDAYSHWASNYYTGTSLHILGMTRRCNLKCDYCHVSVVAENANSSKFDMNEETAKQIVDFIFQSPSKVLHIEFQGGEAILNMPVVKFVYDYARAKNIGYKRELSFSIVSNLVGLSEDVINFLTNSQIHVTTTIELENDNGVAFRTDRKKKSRTDEVKLNRKQFQEQGQLVPMLMVVAKNNIHQIKEYIDYAIDAKQQGIFLAPIQRLGFAKGNWKEVGIEIEEYIEAWKSGIEYIFSLWDKGIFFVERQFMFALQKLFSTKDIRYMDFRNPNGMVLGNLAYDENGDIFACDEGRGHKQFQLGNVFETNYNEATTTSKAIQLVSHTLRDMPICNECGFRTYCHVSPIISKVNSGHLDPQPLIDPYCKLTMGIFDFIFDLIKYRPDRINQAITIDSIINV